MNKIDTRRSHKRPASEPAREPKLPPVERLQELVRTGQAWRRDAWTSRYAAALSAAGMIERGF